MASSLLARQSLLRYPLGRRLASTATNPNPGPPRKSLYEAWFAIEAIPIYVIIGGAMVGAGWYLYRLANQPDVIWSKSNPTPWNTVQPNENIKLFTGNQQFDKSWRRGANPPRREPGSEE